jgi:hypothetical protein
MYKVREDCGTYLYRKEERGHPNQLSDPYHSLGSAPGGGVFRSSVHQSRGCSVGSVVGVVVDTPGAGVELGPRVDVGFGVREDGWLDGAEVDTEEGAFEVIFGDGLEVGVEVLLEGLGVADVGTTGDGTLCFPSSVRLMPASRTIAPRSSAAMA